MLKLKVYEHVERHPCPFYGFNAMYGPIIDTRGNQCALVTTSHSPCQMEVSGQKPDWNSCPIRQKLTEKELSVLEESAKKTTIFPREFQPPQESWTGIKLHEWMSYVLKKK